jgi:hypothetical protein
MVFEENRIFSYAEISSADLDQELKRLRGVFAERWKNFLQDFDLTDSDLRDILKKRLVLKQVVLSRTREGTLQEWLEQLKTRYRVQVLDGYRESRGTR